MRKKIVVAMVAIIMCVCSVNAYTIGGMYVTLIDCSWGENDKAQQEYEQAKKKAKVEAKYQILSSLNHNQEDITNSNMSPGEKIAASSTYDDKVIKILLNYNKDLELAKLNYEANKNGYIGTYKDSSGNLYQVFFGSNYCKY